MRAFHIALLSLAASAVAPVFAAPIPYVVIFTARVVVTPLTLSDSQLEQLPQCTL